MNFAVTNGETIVRTGIAGPRSVAVIREKCEVEGNVFHELADGENVSGARHWYDEASEIFVDRAAFPVAPVHEITAGDKLTMALPEGTMVSVEADTDVTGALDYEKEFPEEGVYHVALRHHRYVNLNVIVQVGPPPVDNPDPEAT